MKNDKGELVKYQYVRDKYPIKSITFKDKSNETYKTKSLRINILVAKHFCPIRKEIVNDEKLHVHHIDLNPLNNAFWNLIWVTFNEHYILHDQLGGHISFFNTKPTLKYNDDQVYNVCELLKCGTPVIDISNITGVSTDMIYAIKTGKYRKDITSKYNLSAQHNHLSDDQIHEICKLIESGYSNADISRICNISNKRVSEIRSGRSYYRISKNYNINYTSNLYIK